MLPGLQHGGSRRPHPGPGPAASPGRARARPATSRCCARPAGTVPQHGGLPPPMPPGPPRGGLPPPMTPGRVHPARIVPDRGPRPARTRAPGVLTVLAWPRRPAAVPDRGPRPARTRCLETSGRTVLQHGGLPPPIPPGPARPASCPTCPPSPVRAGLLRPPAMTRCCTRPGSAALGRPASPGLRPSLVQVRPAKSRCSCGSWPYWPWPNWPPAWGAPAPPCTLALVLARRGPAACQPPVLPTPWPNSPGACWFGAYGPGPYWACPYGPAFPGMLTGLTGSEPRPVAGPGPCWPALAEP